MILEATVSGGLEPGIFHNFLEGSTFLCIEPDKITLNSEVFVFQLNSVSCPFHTRLHCLLLAEFAKDDSSRAGRYGAFV